MDRFRDVHSENISRTSPAHQILIQKETFTQFTEAPTPKIQEYYNH